MKNFHYTLKTVAGVALLTAVASPAFAGPTCTGDAAMLLISAIAQSFEETGGKIKLIKATKGGCYEIYGYEDGQKVEIYFDSRTGDVLEKHIDD